MIFFYLLILGMPMPHHPLWASFIGGLTVIKYIGILCILYALLYLGTRRASPHYFQTKQARFFLILYLIVTISFLTKGYSSGPWERNPFLIYTSFVFLFFITLTVVDSPKRLYCTLLTAIGSLAFASLYLIREVQHNNFRPAGWVVNDPNYFTVAALTCLPVAVCFLLTPGRPRWERWFCLGAGTLTLRSVSTTLRHPRAAFSEPRLVSGGS